MTRTEEGRDATETETETTTLKTNDVDEDDDTKRNDDIDDIDDRGHRRVHEAAAAGVVMRDERRPIRTTSEDDEEEENDKAEADRETRREDAAIETETETTGMIDDDANATTTTQRVIAIIVGKNIENVTTAPSYKASRNKPTMDLAPEVLRVLAAHIEEDVLSGNHDLVKPQRITFVRASASSSLTSISAAWILALIFNAFIFLAVALALALALAYANKRAVSKKFNAWARERVLDELRKRTTSECDLKSMTVTRKGVVLRGLFIGNASNGGTYKSAHLAQIEEIRVAMDFFSVCGRLQFGNLIFGFVTTKCDEIFMSRASVNVEEDAASGMKNYDIMRVRAPPAKGDATAEGTSGVADRGEKPASGGGFFSGFTDSLEASKRAIDAQVQEAMKLPGAVAGSLKNAGADVTKRLYALASILERLKRSTPLDNEEEKHLDVLRLRRAPMVLRVNNLTLYEWSLCIAAVADTPFQFRLFEVNNFIGTPGALGKKVAIGVVSEIMNDFHRKMFGNIADGVGNVANGIFDAGSFVVGGVTSGVGSAVNAVGSGLNTVTTAVVTGTSRY